MQPVVALGAPPRGPYRDPTLPHEISSPSKSSALDDVASAAFAVGASSSASRGSPTSGSDSERGSELSAFNDVFRTPRIARGGSGAGTSSGLGARGAGGAGSSSSGGAHHHHHLRTPGSMMADSPLNDLAEVANLLASGGSVFDMMSEVRNKSMMNSEGGLLPNPNGSPSSMMFSPGMQSGFHHLASSQETPQSSSIHTRFNSGGGGASGAAAASVSSSNIARITSAGRSVPCSCGADKTAICQRYRQNGLKDKATMEDEI